VLGSGLKDFREQAENKLAELDLTDHTSLSKSYFYRSVLIVIDAVKAFADRYAQLAEESARTEKDEKRKIELEEMGRVLRKVPYEKAESFYEAVQSLWLVHLCLQIESNGHSLSYGRMDQYLKPFYEKDLSNGKISEEAACELLVNLWLKTFTITKIRSWTHTQLSAGGPLYQNVTVAGQFMDAEGRIHNAANPTTHKSLDNRFMKECVEVVRLGFGMPAFNSDEVIIPSFIEKGVAKEDAYDYSAWRWRFPANGGIDVQG
jgi:formate C-acetyltransferase